MSAFGAVVGAAYGFGISVVVESGLFMSLVVTLVGSVIVGLIGFAFSDRTEYRPIQKVFLVPLAPFVVVASSLGMVLAVIVLAPALPVIIFAGFLGERRLRARMKAARRYLSWSELLPWLRSGQGTLLAESHGTGPFRIWYTPDDVLAEGEPISTDAEMIGVLTGKISHVFNSRCCREYLDAATGTALLTSIRPGWVMTDRFKRRFPHISVVRLFRPLGHAGE